MSSKLLMSLAGLMGLASAGCGTGNAPPPDAAARAAELTGVWSGPFTTQQHEYWQLEDLTACAFGCTPAARNYYAGLIDDPVNDEQPVQELWSMTTAFMRDELARKAAPEGAVLQEKTAGAVDRTFRCVPFAFARAVLTPLPIEIRSEGANLVIAYQGWNETRTIFMDGREHPRNLAPTRLGHSVGRYEGNALVIETKGVEPNLYYDFQSGGGHSAEATFRERYTIRDDPRRLELELEITDTVTLWSPHVVRKSWLSTPDVQLAANDCDAPDFGPLDLEPLRRRRR